MLISESTMNYNGFNKLQEAYTRLDSCVNSILPLYDIVKNKVFKKLDYNFIMKAIPMWMEEAGNGEESTLSKEFFEEFVKKLNSKTANRILYYFDFTHLLSALQDRFRMVKGNMSEVYSLLTYPTSTTQYVSAVRNTSLYEASRLSDLYSIYIYLCSSMDLMTKVIYELDNFDSVTFNKYPRLNSEKVIYRKTCSFVKKLSGKNIFNPTEYIYEICELRNRVIHNGSFDYSLWIYDCCTENDKIESVIFLPDVKDGHIVKYINRNNFYHQNRTVNMILVEQVLEFCSLFLSTVNQVSSIYKEQDISDFTLTSRYLQFIMKIIKKIDKHFFCSQRCQSEI